MAYELIITHQEYIGASTDVKPTGTTVSIGSTFYEYDTKNQYVYTPISTWALDLRTNQVLRGELIKITTGNISSFEILSDSQISNFGQVNDVTLTLPVAEKGLGFIVLLGTTVAKYYRIKASTNDKIILDGTAGADNGYVGIASAVQGAMVTFISFQTGASVYDWIATSVSGLWVAG